MNPAAVRHRERGIILIAVLLSVAIMSVMVVATAALTRAGIGSELLEQRRLNSHFALRSALEVAKALILVTPPEERVFFDGTAKKVAAGGAVSAMISITDAAGLVDLNQSDPALIEALARSSGLPLKQVSGLAEKIVKLRKDAAPPQPGGLKPAVVPPNAPQPVKAADQARPGDLKPGAVQPQPVIFLSVDQLQALADLTSDEGESLMAALTVFSPTGMINPLAAPEAVLNGIPGIAPADFSVFAAAKRSRKWKSDARIAQIMERTKPVLALEEPSVFVIEVKLEPGEGYLAGSTARAVVRIGKEGAQPLLTLAMEEQ
ncbi:hypothetical protein [Aestuariivirga sp.]|uniref:hypothetical protein n=1 Tax=Aestuariivirga sp. TaxID=2650926 RepID=UPI003BAAD3C0